MIGAAVALTTVSTIAEESRGAAQSKSIIAERPYSPSAERNFPTDVYFGDTHVHTGHSADAGGAGTTLMPRDAYRFALGEQVTSNSGLPVKLARPYDFFMITDHTDAMGAIVDIIQGAPNVMATESGRRYNKDFNEGGDVAGEAMWRLIAEFGSGKLDPALNYQPGNPAFKRTWDTIVEAAEEFNDPGVFTTFIAFEWTSLEMGNNLHRNVIFRDGADLAGEIVPYTTTPPQGSNNPRDLWKWLQKYEDDTGGNVTAIPHNGNLSSGMMFALTDDFAEGKPAIDAEYAATRNKWERLYETTQPKGDSEAHPKLSPEDEFADYETWDWGNLDLSTAKTDEMLPGEYAREALKRGLVMKEKLGANPFKYGMAGGTDIHTALSTQEEDNFFGKYATYEPTNEKRAMHVADKNEELGIGYKGWRYNAAGVTAVWAQSNTREAIFDAMERRETFSTTGPRMRVRFFGGWSFVADDARNRQLAVLGYGKGVPMGADMPAAPAGAKAPNFLVSAQRDPMGANLDRVQIIKGWVDARTGQSREKIYDVAWSGDRKPRRNGKLPAVGDTVDLSVPTWTNTIGASELTTVWQDPDFDPSERAFYYVRVLEIPTPRWPAYDAVRFGISFPEEVVVKGQERAYSSPIWFEPNG
tara:strand:+ start:44579 stop:46501 length:1923 start_codon:yes stop_codon:yes gene_type:complete